jgi:hypothetical protein
MLHSLAQVTTARVERTVTNSIGVPPAQRRRGRSLPCLAALTVAPINRTLAAQPPVGVNRGKMTSPPLSLVTELPPDILATIMTASVLASDDPGQRIDEICNGVSNESALYDILNHRLGWYGLRDGMHEKKKQIFTYKSNKLWFLYCCDLYKKYGNVCRSRYKHGGPVTVYDIGLLKEEEWILKAVAASYSITA